MASTRVELVSQQGLMCYRTEQVAGSTSSAWTLPITIFFQTTVQPWRTGSETTTHGCNKEQLECTNTQAPTSHTAVQLHTHSAFPGPFSLSIQCCCHLRPYFVSINLTVARHGLLRRRTSLCNLLLMCCTLSLSEPIWSHCEQTAIASMLSEQV